MRLPPFGRKFQSVPRSGVRVALGPKAWAKAARHKFPIMVLPQDCDPAEFHWPSNGHPALIFECGQYDDLKLEAMAYALLRDGTPSAVAIREAMLDSYDPRVYFDPQVIGRAA